MTVLRASDPAVVLDEIDLLVTGCCNLDCGFCSVRARPRSARPEDGLSLPRIRALIDEGAALGMEQLHLTGGEPTLRSDLEQIVAHAADRAVETRLITNGTLLDRTRLRALQRAGLRNIMVSIDGLERTHDALRGVPGAFRRAMGCVDNALDLGLRTRISAVVFADNQREVPELMELAAARGVDIFSIFLGAPLGRGEGWQERLVPPAAWRDFVESLAADVERGRFGAQMAVVAEQGFVWADTEGFDPRGVRGRGEGCSQRMADFDYLMVRPDGRVYQCVFFIHEGQPLGDVSVEPLGVLLERAQRSIDGSAQVPTGCDGCPLFRGCRGGCRGYAYLYTGCWQARDPRCVASGEGAPLFFPLCPIAKRNLRSGRIKGSSEHALADR